MKALLQIIEYEAKKQGKNIPLLMEFPIPPGLGFVLVSSSKDLLWLRPQGDRVRAALRQVPMEDFFLEAVRAIASKGRVEEWGNVHAFTALGLKAAINHVLEYGFPSLEILTHPNTSWGKILDEPLEISPKEIFGVPVEEVDWLTPDTVVVIPSDREYVGFVMLLQGHLTSVVHNAARAVGIATSWK